jgi:hypothetical protein
MIHFTLFINLFNIIFLLIFYITFLYSIRHQFSLLIFGIKDDRGLSSMDFPIGPFDLFVICFVADFCAIHLAWRYHTETPGYTIYEATQHLTDVISKYQDAYSRGEVFIPSQKQVTIIKDGFINTAEFTLVCVVIAGVFTYLAFYLSGPAK